jgi:hypothetical protein
MGRQPIALGLLLQLEHNNDAELYAAWRLTSDKAEAYSICCDRWRMKHTHETADEAEKGCAPFRSEPDETVKVFTDRLISLRSTAVSKGPAASAQK